MAYDYRSIDPAADQIVTDDSTGAFFGFRNKQGKSLIPPVFTFDDNGNVTGLSGPGGRGMSLTGALDVRGYGAKCDGQAVYDATTTASAVTTVTSATAAFSRADVGKRIAILAYGDVASAFYGVVTAVNADGSLVASVNASPGVLTAAVVVWASDDTAAYNAALTAAKHGVGVVQAGPGISGVTGPLTIPVGVTLRGVANLSSGGKAKDFKYAGSSIVALKFSGAGVIIAGDSTGSDPKGTILKDINIDAFGLAFRAYDGSNSSRTSKIQNATLLRGQGETVFAAPTSSISDCCILGQNQAANVVQLQGDAKFGPNNIVTGSGNGFYQVKVSNAADVTIFDNHLWKDANLPAMLGGQLFASYNSASSTASLTVTGNKFDTSYGPHVLIKVSGNSTARGINISDNQGFANDLVPNATYPWMQVEVDAGSSLRMLGVHDNTGCSSWNDPTKGTLTFFVDNGATAGAIVGSSITGNEMDNCAAGYNALTPSYSAGNIFVAGTGAAATVF